MMQYYGAGVQACYRGPRLYDTDTTKKTVTDVINGIKNTGIFLIQISFICEVPMEETGMVLCM